MPETFGPYDALADNVKCVLDATDVIIKTVPNDEKLTKKWAEHYLIIDVETHLLRGCRSP